VTEEQDESSENSSTDTESESGQRTARNIYTGLPSVSGDNQHTPPFAPVVNDAYRQMFAYRRFLTRWTREWGPVVCWPTFIMQELQEREKLGEQKEWRQDMLGKAEQGRVIVSQLKGMFNVLPSDPWQVRDLWLQACDISEHIQAGIACLNAHLDIEASM
jgi:hypothetical protein